MKHIALEQELRARDRKHRIMEAMIGGIFLIVTVVFAALYEQSKVVEETGLGLYKYVTYNTDFLWGILVGALGLTVSAIVLISDFVFSKLVTVQVDSDYITLYRGLRSTNLFVNGECQDTLFMSYYLEGTLTDGSKVNVALGKWSAHLTFTNGCPPIDV